MKKDFSRDEFPAYLFARIYTQTLFSDKSKFKTKFKQPDGEDSSIDEEIVRTLGIIAKVLEARVAFVKDTDQRLIDKEDAETFESYSSSYELLEGEELPDFVSFYDPFNAPDPEYAFFDVYN